MTIQKDLNGQAAGRASGQVRPAAGRLLLWLRRGGEGQSLVELALALPILMALVWGLFSIGNAMIVYEQLGEAAFAGDDAMASNEGLIDTVTSTQTDLCAKAKIAVTTVLSAPAWSTANLAKITYSATLDKTANGVTTTTPVPATTGTFSCAALSTSLGPKSNVTLTLSYPYTWLPFYGKYLGTITIKRQQSVLAY